MKLRLQSDSICVRLSEAEVQQLAAAGELSEQVSLGSGAAFTYRVELSDVATLQVLLESNTFLVLAPGSAMRDWARGTATSLDASSETDAAMVAIERDLPRRAK